MAPSTTLKAYFEGPRSPNYQKERLLSQSLPSPGRHSRSSSGQSSPLKPLHLVNEMENQSGHQKRQSLVDFEALKRAHDQDAVRQVSRPALLPLILTERRPSRRASDAYALSRASSPSSSPSQSSSPSPLPCTNSSQRKTFTATCGSPTAP